MYPPDLTYLARNASPSMKFLQQFPQYAVPVNWYPGHMCKGIRIFGETTSQVDLYLEVRDARLPYSSRNDQFDSVIRAAQKRKIIVFNKLDLCDKKVTMRVIEDYRQLGIDCFTLEAKNHVSLRKFLEELKLKVPVKHSTVGAWMGICGMPNVGKSTLLNQIRTNSDLSRKQAVTKSAPLPSTTRHHSSFRVFESPALYMVDCPGIMVPSNVPNEVGFKLCLLGMVSSKVVNKHAMLQYFVWFMNRHKREEYFRKEGLEERPANAEEYLLKVRERKRLHNYEQAHEHIFERFREGYYGGFTLDDPE